MASSCRLAPRMARPTSSSASPGGQPRRVPSDHARLAINALPSARIRLIDSVVHADPLRLAGLPIWPAIRAPRVIMHTLTCGASCRGARSAASIRSRPAQCTWSCTSAGCKKCAGSSHRRCRGGSRLLRGSIASASSTACLIILRPSMSTGLLCRRSPRRWGSPTCSSRRC